jgi:hypothetical protein
MKLVNNLGNRRNHSLKWHLAMSITRGVLLAPPMARLPTHTIPIADVDFTEPALLVPGSRA